VLFIPCCPGYTGLTGALGRSDRCNPRWVFARVTSGCVRCCPVLQLFRVWVSLEVGWPVWCFGGFQAVTGLTDASGLTGVEPLNESCPVSPAGTGLTGSAHRSDRCWSVDSRFGVPLRSRVGRVCVLVPRSSGTPVATWAWPTWVVSRRCVLEAVFILLEFPSPSRRIFIGSHSLPSLWFAVSVLHRPGPGRRWV
jgi:hypothetical protein